MIKNVKEYKIDYQPPKWGFYLFSEIINGRLAMIAIVIVLCLEIFTKKSLLMLLQDLINR